MNWNHTIATANIFIGLIGFIWLVIRTSSRWGEYPAEVKLLLVSTACFVLVLIESSIELLTRGQFSINAVLITAAKLFLLYTLFKTRGTLYRTGTRAPGNGDEINPDRAITASHVPIAKPGETEQGPQPVEQPGDRP